MISNCFFIIFAIANFGIVLSNQHDSFEVDSRRNLIKDGDGSKVCFDLNYNKGYADYILDPFKANNNRGDWGKCMDEQLFGSLCIHDEMHGINNNQWTKDEGPLHDGFAESMFLRLKKYHNDNCLHVDLKYTPLLKQKLNDLFFARNEYSQVANNDTTGTFYFDTLIGPKGNYLINGNILPTLQLLKGSTYYFMMKNEDYIKYPLSFGTTAGVTSFLVTAKTEYDLTKVTLTLPFDAPNSISYFSLKDSKIIGTANLMEPSSFKISPRDGVYYVNNFASPTLSLYRGAKYSFIVLNSDQQIFPFMIGTDFGVPYFGGAISMRQGSYYTIFTVSISDPSVTKLVYYSVNYPGMSGLINIVENPYTSRKLVMEADDDGFMLPFDKTCSGNYKTGDPRALLRMSLYCSVARMDQWIPANVQAAPYAISKTCDKIVRSFMTAQSSPLNSKPPLQYCGQGTDKSDSCTIQAPLDNFIGRTCKEYCEGFDGLTCAAASVMSDGIYCQTRRKWSCNAPQQNEKSLICTCAPKINVVVSTLAANVPPTGKTTNVPTQTVLVGINNKAKAPKPSVKPSTALPTFAALKKNESLSNACLNLMFQDQPIYNMKQICSSSSTENSCLVSVSSSYTCATYCSSFSGMQCSSAYTPLPQSNCRASNSLSCGTKITGSNNILCKCSFMTGARQAKSLTMSLFSKGLPYCPAYPSGTFTDDSIMQSNTMRRLDDSQDKRLYGRTYKKVTLTLDYNAAKGDGSAKVIDAETKWDTNNWSTDTYNTGTPEMCTGLVSRIRKGDPPSKCSFGNRPKNSPSNNCYGKLYRMTFGEASTKCAARGGNLAKIDTLAEFQAVTSMFVNDDELSIGLHDVSGNDWRWDGYPDAQAPSSWFSSVPFVTNSWYDDCTKIDFDSSNSGVKKPFITTAKCSDKLDYICESKPTMAGNAVAGDLLADEGGFCIWYYDNPKISLPDDESGGFKNTELSYFNLYDPKLKTKKYVKIFNELIPAEVNGRTSNKANFDMLTARMFGRNSDEKIIPSGNFNSSFHCHFTPTNFGVSRIYSMQHMVERLYTGSASKHCFCGYKYIGHLFDRCDCTRSGEKSNNCLTEHSKLLYEETYAETGEYVYCNNCNNPSP